LPIPTGGGASVRNVLAFHVLHTVFVKAKTEGLRSVVLDQVDAVFIRDPANYFITETQHTIAMFIEHLPKLSPALQLKVFRFLEFIVCKLNFVPFPELASLSIQLESSGRGVAALAMQAVVQFTNYDPKYVGGNRLGDRCDAARCAGMLAHQHLLTANRQPPISPQVC
jgi:hypothetical protein